MKEHGSTPGKAIPDNLNRYFDSTLLKPEATERQIENLCGAGDIPTLEGAAGGLSAQLSGQARAGG